MGEAIGIGIVVLIWAVSSLIKGFKWLLVKSNAPPGRTLPQAPPPSQGAPQAFQQSPARPLAPPPSRPAPGQTLQGPPPSRPVRPEQPRVAPRQPSAGPPAVTAETTRQDFERQEQDLTASEPRGLDTPLTSVAASGSAAQRNGLFAGTDDLVRAIILQEALGPPLSRRSSGQASPAPPPQ